eukprot:752664-Hanusia_phi.AAC.2
MRQEEEEEEEEEGEERRADAYIARHDVNEKNAGGDSDERPDACEAPGNLDLERADLVGETEPLEQVRHHHLHLSSHELSNCTRSLVLTCKARVMAAMMERAMRSFCG